MIENKIRLNSNLLLYFGVIVSGFGPYVIMDLGLRSEHLFIYSILPISIIYFLFQGDQIRFNKTLSFILFLLLFVTIETLIVTYIGTRNYFSFSKSIAYFENYFQPIAIIIILSVFANYFPKNKMILILKKIIHIFLILLVLNSLLIILSIFFGTLPIIDFFVANTNKGLSVSEMAAQSGRFSGIFDQPSEAGLSYSLGILLWLYLFSNKKKIKSYDFFLLLMLFIGGIGTISKIFLIGGSVLFLMYLIYLKGISKFFSFRAIFLGGLISLLLYQFLQFFWTDGLEFLLRLFFLSPDTDLVYLYSAGRFGGSPTYLKNIIDEIWRISPIYGEGFAYELILDNAYAEFFVQGGIIGLAGYILILVSILKTCIWSYRYNKRESILLLFILLLIIGGGLGTPVLTVNRFSTFCWVFIFMIFQILENRVYKYEY